jgi:iron(III) transport system ATP-binding protein
MTEIRTEAVGVVIKDLSLSFGDTKVLKSIDLKIEPGEFFTFLGPSGSGKSTLLRAIAGFGPTPGGKIMIGDDDVTQLAPWTRNVGMVFQSYALWPHMTVRKNVAFGLEERKIPASKIIERVDNALNLVGLLDLAERRPSQLSGGQQQRVALARTIVIEPRILLLDEPLSNLDANLRIQMRRDILELQRKLKLTTIFVTHDQEEANSTSDRIAVLDQGIIQQVGSPIDLYDNPVNRFVADFLGTANLISTPLETADGGPLYTSGEGRTAMFRPQDLTIQQPPGNTDSDAAILLGQVKHREFLGSLIRYNVSVTGHTLIVDDSHTAGRQAFAAGDNVALSLDINNIRILTD